MNDRQPQCMKPFMLEAAADSRADHDHQAVAEGTNPNHQIGQGEPEFQQANGPLVVVIAIEKD